MPTIVEKLETACNDFHKAIEEKLKGNEAYYSKRHSELWKIRLLTCNEIALKTGINTAFLFRVLFDKKMDDVLYWYIKNKWLTFDGKIIATT